MEGGNTMIEIPLKLRLTIDSNEARIIRDALIDYTRRPDVSKEDNDTTWLLLIVLAKKTIGR
jgi:hypothetical protein